MAGGKILIGLLCVCDLVWLESSVRTRSCRVLANAWLLSFFLLVGVMSHSASSQQLPESLAACLQQFPSDAKVGFVVLDRDQHEVFSHQPDQPLACASSIKAAILLELFARYADGLDETGRADIAKIVTSRRHPAIKHFAPSTQQEIAADLRDVSINELGKIMIDSQYADGRDSSNTTYNAATNVAIALLGGPRATTRRIHQRDKLLEGLTVRRYMLADRKAKGDNTATPRSLATVFAMTVGKQLPKLDAPASQAAVDILHARDFPNGSQLYAKGGSLYSDPVTSVRAGQLRSGDSQMNYAIMVVQDLQSPQSGKTQYEALSEQSLQLFGELTKQFASASADP